MEAALQATWPHRLGRRQHARLLLFGVGGGDDLSASRQCARRAAELADADGQLRQLESLRAHPDQSWQRGQSQGQVHGLAVRPGAAQQGHPVFHPARRGRLSLCRQPVAPVLEVRCPRREAQGGVEVRRQGAGRRQQLPQPRASRQQRLHQHRQGQSQSAPDRARQEFRRGGVRREHRRRRFPQPRTLGGAVRSQGQDFGRLEPARRERPRLCRCVLR